MTTEIHNHEGECLMCAVRALTEGIPPVWNPVTPGEKVGGVVLKMGEVATDFGAVPFVDLWLGGHRRQRIMAYGVTLRHALDSAAARVGDTLTVWLDGEAQHPRTGRSYKRFSSNVQRGHSA